VKFFQLFLPDRKFGSTEEALRSIPEDMEAVVLDIDGVLVDPGLEVERENMDGEIYSLLKQLIEDFDLCLLSNRVREDDFSSEEVKLFDGMQVVENHLKPDSEAFESALDRLDVDRSNAVMIGDSPYTDVYGANKSGLKVFQVDQDRSKYSLGLMISKSFEDVVQRIARYLTNK
jgi:FMN phosphatase YigB (HAD superfamily)